MFCVLSIGGVGLRSTDPFVEGLCAVLATIVVLAIGGGILWYSHVHPDQATLEGMEVVVLHQQKAWAAKGMDLPKDSPIIPNPGGTPPQLNPPDGADQ